MKDESNYDKQRRCIMSMINSDYLYHARMSLDRLIKVKESMRND